MKINEFHTQTQLNQSRINVITDVDNLLKKFNDSPFIGLSWEKEFQDETGYILHFQNISPKILWPYHFGLIRKHKMWLWLTLRVNAVKSEKLYQ